MKSLSQILPRYAHGLGLAGLVVVLGGNGLPWPHSIGDWLALGSGGAFAGEPFALREALGALLIIAAGLVEVLGRGDGA